jgi:hypothetical protein
LKKERTTGKRKGKIDKRKGAKNAEKNGNGKKPRIFIVCCCCCKGDGGEGEGGKVGS